MPMPEAARPPTWMPLLMTNNCEPEPVTVTSPLARPVPMLTPPKVVSVPPFVMVRLPTPTRVPTSRDPAIAPGAATTVGFGFTVLMVAFVPAGTPAVQLPALNQLESIAPVQLVWARVDTVDAEINAITAVVVSKCMRIDAPRLNAFAL